MSDLWGEIDDINREGTRTRYAAEDYPELAQVVEQHLPPQVYRQVAAAKVAGLGRWMRNQVSDWLEKEILLQPTNWCRFREGDQCRYPHRLDFQASLVAGHAVWSIEDRGTCQRPKWEQQMECPIGDPGPEVGGGPRPSQGQEAEIIPVGAG